MNLCGVRVNRIQELWLTPEQFRDWRKALAMMNAGAELQQGHLMNGCAIALVAGKAIAGKLPVERFHNAITRDFRND